MPLLLPLSTAPVGARIALVLSFCLAAAGTAAGQVPLRPGIGPDGPAAGASQIAQSFPLSPPGAGAGSTGFVSVTEPGDGPVPVVPPAANVEAAPPPAPAPRRMPTLDPYGPVGYRAGSFIVRPSLELFAGYDDNPLRRPAARGSAFERVEGRIDTRSDWSRHELVSELRGAFTRFERFENNDRPEADARIRGRIDVSSMSRIELGAAALLTTEAAGSPDAVTSARHPPAIYTYAGDAGFVQQFNRFQLGMFGEVERRTHEAAKLIGGGNEDLSDRDYVAYGGRLRGSYETMPGTRMFAEAEFDTRKFDRAVDFSGVRRGSNGWQILAGLEFEQPGRITGEIAAGYAQRRYDDPALDEISGLVVDASLVWNATALTAIRLRAASEIGETTLAGASGVFRRAASVIVDHAFRRWLIGSASIAYGVDDYSGAGRRDNLLSLAAALTYHMNRAASLRGEVRRERLSSTAPGQDYTANIVMVGLRLQR